MLMFVTVLMIMIVVVIMMVTVVMIVAVIMRVTVVMIMVMRVMIVMQMRVCVWRTRVLAEHQRFDGDGHGLRRPSETAEIDIIKIPQDHSIDDEDLARDAYLFAQDRAQCLGDISVEHDEQRQALRDGVGKSAADALRKRRDALI